MTDIVLDTIASGYNLQKINNNFDKVESVINNEMLHTVGGVNNTMQQYLDMNSYDILNLPKPTEPTHPVRLQDLGDFDEITTQRLSLAPVGGSNTLTVTSPGTNYALFINGILMLETNGAYAVSADRTTITLAENLKGNEEIELWTNFKTPVSLEDVEGNVIHHKTKQEAIADTSLVTGKYLLLSGYKSELDGGHGQYQIQTATAYAATPDEKRDFTLSNGHVAVNVAQCVNLLQMGAVAEDISFDNSQIVIDCALSNPDGVARIPLGRFYWDAAIVYPDGFRGILGESKRDSALSWIKTDEGDYGFRAENPTTCKLYRLENFAMVGAGYDEGQLLCKIDRLQYGLMRDVIFDSALVLCDMNDFAFAMDVENCRFGGLDGGTPVAGSTGLILRQNPNGTNFRRCDFYRMDLAVNALQSFATNFTGGCVFENCNRAFNFSNTQKLVISGNYFEKIHDVHFTFSGSALTPKVMVEDNYFIFNTVAESNAILKVDAGAANAKQIVFKGNNFRFQKAGALTSGYIVDITGAGAPLFVWWWNNDIYSSDLLLAVPEAHNMNSPRFIGDVPSYKVNLSTDWSTYEDGVLVNEGPLRVYMDNQTRKPFVKQNVRYVGASGTNTIFTLVSLPASFGISGATAGVPIMTQDITDFSIGKARITNNSDIQIGRGTIADLSNQTFQLDIQWPTEFNRTDPENR